MTIFLLCDADSVDSDTFDGTIVPYETEPSTEERFDMWEWAMSAALYNGVPLNSLLDMCGKSDPRMLEAVREGHAAGAMTRSTLGQYAPKIRRNGFLLDAA